MIKDSDNGDDVLEYMVNERVLTRRQRQALSQSVFPPLRAAVAHGFCTPEDISLAQEKLAK